MSAAQKIDAPTPSDDDETLLVSRPITPNSTTRPSAAPDLPRDTICDPPRERLIFTVLRFVLDVLLFLPRFVARVILAEIHGVTARFKQPPPLCDLLPSPPATIARRNGTLSPDQMAEVIAHDLFRVPPQYLPGLIRIACVLRDAQPLTREEHLDLFVLFCLSRLPEDESNSTPLAWLRQRLPEVHRKDLDLSLERIESEKWIALSDPGIDDASYVRNGVSLAYRPRLTHARALQGFG